MRDKKGLIPNVDFYSATVYHTLGIDSDIFTLIFAMSRICRLDCTYSRATKK